MKHVLITGASTGIGKDCAIELARRGFSVFAGVRKLEDGEALRTEAPENLTPLMLDVTDVKQIEAARCKIEETVGGKGLFGLVNNAGIVVAGPLEFVPIPELRRQFEVNVLGQFAVTQAFLPAIREAKGRIVFMSSLNGRMSTPFNGAYCGSKFALEGLADALRIELGPWGIEVCVVEPGPIETPIWKKSAKHAYSFLDQLPPEYETLYGEYAERFQARLKFIIAASDPPEAVSRAVHHALSARRPRTRYPVGKQAFGQGILVRWVPDRIRDRLIRKYVGLG